MPNPLDTDTVAWIKSNPAPFSGRLHTRRIPPVRTADDLRRLTDAQLRRWVASN